MRTGRARGAARRLGPALALILLVAGLGGCAGPGAVAPGAGPPGAGGPEGGTPGAAAGASPPGEEAGAAPPRKEAWGAPAGDERPAADLYLEVRLLESGGDRPEAPWSIEPRHLEVPLGKVVAIRVVSPRGNRSGHNLVIGPPYSLRSRTIPRGGSAWLVFRADKPGEAIPLECGIAGHPHLGMAGTMTVR